MLVSDAIVFDERRTTSAKFVMTGGEGKLANAHAETTVIDSDTTCSTRLHWEFANGDSRVDRLDINRD